MAIAVTKIATAAAKAASATSNAALTTGVTIGDLVLVLVAADNAGTNGVSSITTAGDDVHGTTNYTALDTNNVTAGTANDGVTVKAFYKYTTSTLTATTNSITINFSPNTTAKAWVAYKITGGSGVAPEAVDVTSNGSGTTYTLATTPTGAVNDLLIGIVGSESNTPPTADTGTTGGSWNAGDTAATGGTGGDGTKLSMRAQYKILTDVTSDTWTQSCTNEHWSMLLYRIKYPATAAAAERALGTGAAYDIPLKNVSAQNTSGTVAAHGWVQAAADPTGSWSSNTASGATFADVVYGNGYWVATSGVDVYYTTDPSGTWNKKASVSSFPLDYITYGYGYFVVSAFDDGGYQYLHYATDPSGTWSQTNMGTVLCTGLAYGADGYFVATNNTGYVFYAHLTPETWDSVQVTTATIKSPSHGNSYWAVADPSEGTGIWYTQYPSGTWTQNNQGLSAGYTHLVEYGDGYWVVYCTSLTNVGESYYSTSASGTFTQGSNFNGSYKPTDIENGNGYWATVGGSVSGAATYNEGTPFGAWTMNAQGSSTWNSIAYGNGTWVMVEFNGANIRYRLGSGSGGLIIAIGAAAGNAAGTFASLQPDFASGKQVYAELPTTVVIAAYQAAFHARAPPTVAAITGASYDAQGLGGVYAAAGLASGTGAAQTTTPSIDARTVGLASATGAAYAATGNPGAAAQVTTGTGAANNAAAWINVPAGVATATGAANNAAFIAAPAQVASGTGAATTPAASIWAVAGVSTATGAAYGTLANQSALAGNGAATFAGLAPTASVHAVAGIATGTGSAAQPAAGISAPAGIATATASANQPAVEASRVAEVAAATGAAYQPSTIINANIGIATGTGEAPDATVAITGNVNAQAELTSVTGSALAPTVSVVTFAGVVSATASAATAAAGIGVAAEITSGTFAAGQATFTLASAGLATGTFAAASATGNVGAAAGLGSATGAANTAAASIALAAGVGSVTASALNTVANQNISAGVAAVTASAVSPATHIDIYATGLASGTGAAYNPSVVVKVVPVWTTPADTVAITPNPELKFLMPNLGAAMHFNLQLDTANTFDTVNLRNITSNTDQTGWHYWDGNAWVAVPAGGVSVIYAGNEARYTVATDLTATTWYRRVRAGV